MMILWNKHLILVWVRNYHSGSEIMIYPHFEKNDQSHILQHFHLTCSRGCCHKSEKEISTIDNEIIIYKFTGKCPQATCSSLTSDMTTIKACMQVIILKMMINVHRLLSLDNKKIINLPLYHFPVVGQLSQCLHHHLLRCQFTARPAELCV